MRACETVVIFNLFMGKKKKRPVPPIPPKAVPFPTTAPTWRYPFVSGVIAAVLFVLLCVTGIEGQGLYYDEVHQAPASFLLLGKARYTFTPLAWGKIPLLTMPYSGAVKSILYGAWMRLSGMGFTVVSWRLFGIFLVGIGLFLFCLFTARALRPAGLGIFLFFFLSDVSVLMMSRHDWGPTALALMLRLVWLGIWVREGFEEVPGTAVWGLLGFIPAFSVYEKLNNVVLLGPLALAVLLSGKKFFVRRVVSASVGFLVGLIPLAVVNLVTGGISFGAYQEFSAKAASGELALAEMLTFFNGFFSMGDGQGVRHFIMGVQPVPWIHLLEISFVMLFLGVTALFAAGSWRKEPHARLAGIGLMAYLSIILLILCLLPKGTGSHHWLAGTPFQYVSIAMAAGLIRKELFHDSPRSGAFFRLKKVSRPVDCRVVHNICPFKRL
jgi:hypothetical protein